MVHPVVAEVTARIIERSKSSRRSYMEKIETARQRGVNRSQLSCSNLAHGFAACGQDDKANLKRFDQANIGIITAYNDMLSAHQPYKDYPDIIKSACRQANSIAQVAGGVPAMCDGVTQGQPGMELSLLSREVIALSTAVGLSHNMFDGALLLGICDKIVPGLTIGALSFGHLPILFVPAGPMPSGLPNKQKAEIRQQYAEGKVGDDALLEAESGAYHTSGTCTFYGTANSNQLVLEAMGLQLPGSSFINPDSPLRRPFTEAAARQVCRHAQSGDFCLAEIYTEQTVVNGMIALLATGGSTNLTIHLVAMADAAGIKINWQDFEDLSNVVPLLARVYPNGDEDVNAFQAAGGVPFLLKELLGGDLLHKNVKTVAGDGLALYTKAPRLVDGNLSWEEIEDETANPKVLRPISDPFQQSGGLKLLQGNMGRSVIKVSAVAPEHRVVEAPAVVFESQSQFEQAFRADKLNKDFIAVVRYQGPKANGMPELHKLTPSLAVLQERGHKVALVTDGRMSGASGKIAAAIHLTPEAIDNGLIAKIRDGDLITLDANKGQLTLAVPEHELVLREAVKPDLDGNNVGMGRELFLRLRDSLTAPESGSSALFS